MTLDCVLQDSNQAFVAGLEPEINFRACLRVLQELHHITTSVYYILNYGKLFQPNLVIFRPLLLYESMYFILAGSDCVQFFHH
jgi:hypothetical protein